MHSKIVFRKTEIILRLEKKNSKIATILLLLKLSLATSYVTLNLKVEYIFFAHFKLRELLTLTLNIYFEK